MAFILHPNPVHDLLDAKHGRHQKLTRLFQSQGMKIEPRGSARFGPEQMMKIREREIYAPGQAIQREVSMKFIPHQIND